MFRSIFSISTALVTGINPLLFATVESPVRSATFISRLIKVRALAHNVEVTGAARPYCAASD